MIAAEVRRTFEIGLDVVSVPSERADKSTADAGLERSPLLERGDRPNQVYGSNSHFHRIDPVDADTRRIGVQPGRKLRLEFDA